eukprot:6618954-Ditylum_brightwellii.AAC.1
MRKGICGLKQAAILAYKQLVEILSTHRYSPIRGTNGLWKHKERATVFSLCVDNFGVKYFNKQDADHLIEGHVDVSMPGYILKALEKFQYKALKYLQQAPHQWNKPVYGHKIQYMKAPDISIHLDTKGQCPIQLIIGTFLHYARAIDGIDLPAINDI